MTGSPVPLRVALLGPYGFGNLGDAAIQDAVIAAVRARRPDARIHGISLNPLDTETRHGIPAHPLYPGWTRPAHDEASPPPERVRAPSWRARALNRITILAPLTGVARTALHAAERLRTEARFSREIRRLLGGFDLLLVSGGGQIDDSWGGPRRHPFTLYRWCRQARRAGTRVAFASIGAGPLRRARSRTFFRRALALADYRSYRDDASRAVVRSWGLGVEDGVVPDLAYALPPCAAPARREPGLVGVSPMALFDPRAWPERDADAYRAYLGVLAAVIDDLLARGRRVEIFLTNVQMDRPAVADLRALLSHGAVSETTATSVTALWRRLPAYECVVASRYHGVLLAHASGVPVVALPHHQKVRSLMEEAGQAAYCLEPRALDPAAARAALRALEARRDEEATRVRAHAARCRLLVERQFDLLFGPTGVARAAPGDLAAQRASAV